MSELQLCTFWIDSNLFGLPVDQVHEIARLQPLASVPPTPASVAGLMNLRGDIVPAIDVRRCLGLEPESASGEGANIILRGENQVSLVVDEIGDIASFSSDQLLPPPQHISGVMRSLVESVVQLGEDLVLVVSGQGFLSMVTEEIRTVAKEESV